MNIININNFEKTDLVNLRVTQPKQATGDILKTHRYFQTNLDLLPRPKIGKDSPFALFSQSKRVDYSFKASFPGLNTLEGIVQFDRKPTVLEEYVKSVGSQTCLKPSHTYPSPCDQFTGNVKKSPLLRDVQSSEREKRIMEKALSSEAIRELYELANRTPTYNSQSGPWTIKFVDKNTLNGFIGMCHYSQRQIHLHPDLTDEMAISVFVFELTNGISSMRHYELYKKVLYGQIGCEEYVKESERIEYEGTLLHHEVISEAIREMGWREDMDMYKGISDYGFELYWKNIKGTSHADYYRNAWASLQKTSKLN